MFHRGSNRTQAARTSSSVRLRTPGPAGGGAQAPRPAVGIGSGRARVPLCPGNLCNRHGHHRRAPYDRPDRRPRRSAALHRFRDRDQVAVRGGGPSRRPSRAPRRARRVPVYARHPSRHVPHAAVDDAPVRGLREREGIERALPLPARARLHRVEHGFRSADPARPRLGRPALPGGGRSHRRRDRHDRRHAHRVRRHPAGPGLDLDDDQCSGERASAALRVGRRGAGRPGRGAPRHDSERHPQGVHRPRELHLPARGGDPADDGSVRLLQRASAQVEHNLDLGLPLPREGLLGGPGGSFHPRQRDRLCAGGARCGTGD
jgi:hypothetical protein